MGKNRTHFLRLPQSHAIVKLHESRITRIPWILRYLPSKTGSRLGEFHTELNGSDLPHFFH